MAQRAVYGFSLPHVFSMKQTYENHMYNVSLWSCCMLKVLMRHDDYWQNLGSLIFIGGIL